jgi:hypothetical protein
MRANDDDYDDDVKTVAVVADGGIDSKISCKIDNVQREKRQVGSRHNVERNHLKNHPGMRGEGYACHRRHCPR